MREVGHEFYWPYKLNRRKYTEDGVREGSQFHDGLWQYKQLPGTYQRFLVVHRDVELRFRLDYLGKEVDAQL